MPENDQKQNSVWRLGIHGARSTGKTCYLASLYGFRAPGDGAGISFVDDPTIDYLAEKWEYLSQGKKLPPTAGTPSELRCQFKAERRVWEVLMHDYPGELVERKGASEVPELRVQTREWLKACNAILFFLDVTDPEDAVRERLNELDLILAELHKLSADGNSIARPLALILTKWDTRPSFKIDLANPTVESQEARRFMRESPVFGQFYGALEQSGDRLEIFPISAFGTHRDGNLPPPGGPKPFNIHTPLAWALSQGEQMIAQKALRAAAGFTAKPWPGYSSAISVLKQAITEYRIHRGPVHEQLSQEIHVLRSKLWRRRTKTFSVTLGIAFIGICIALIADERTQHMAIIQAYANPAIDTAGIKSQTDRYLERRNFLKTLLRHDTDIRERWATRQTMELERDFQNLSSFRNEHATDAEATTRFEKDDAYLKLWGGGAHAAEVADWKANDAISAKVNEARLVQDSRYQGLLTELSAFSKANRFPEAAQACRRFLQECPNSSYQAEVEKRVRDIEAAAAEYEWKTVVAFKLSNRSSYDEIIKQANAYLVKPGAKYRELAEKLVEDTEKAWDRALYERLRTASRAGTDANAIESTQRHAVEYSQGPQPHKQMTDAVQKWLNWFNGLQEERDYDVVVRSMNVPKGSELEPSLPDPNCRVSLSLHNRSHWTNWQRGMQPQYGEKKGPFKFKWGQSGTLNIKIEGYHPTWANDTVEKSFTDDRFILSLVNGARLVRDRNGKDVLVYLECEAAVPPELPAFRD